MLCYVSVAPALVAIVLACAACASIPVEQRTTEGPLAEEIWIYRIGQMNGREPTFEERRRWEGQLDLAISRYLVKDQEFANSPQLTTFRFIRQASVGMSKEQVTILLGLPDRVATESVEVERLASKYWVTIKDGSVSEAWVYPLGWRLYFSESRLVDITQYLPR